MPTMTIIADPRQLEIQMDPRYVYAPTRHRGTVHWVTVQRPPTSKKANGRTASGGR